MASSRFSIEAVISMIDRVTGPMKNANRSVSMFSGNAQKSFAGVGAFASRTGSVIKGIIGASLLQGAVTNLTGTIDRAINLASDLTEVQNVVDTTFGKGAKTINDWSKTAITQFGLSELEAKRFNGTMGAMLKSSGLPIDNLVSMSTKLSGLAGDFASFYNLDTQAAFDKIRSGISGETEPLKQLGINMSIANLQAFALTQGITKQWKNMAQAEQVMLRYKYLMQVSKDAQGDFSKTLMTSYANQKRVFSTNLDQTLARIATQILPDLTNGIIYLNKWLSSVDAKSIGEDIRFVSKMIWDFRYIILFAAGAWGAYRLAVIASRVATIGLIAVSVGLKAFEAVRILGFVDALKYLTTGTKAATIATKAWTAAQWAMNTAALANPYVLIAVAIAALIAQIYLVIKYWESWGSILMIFMGPMGLILNIIMTIKNHWGKIVDAFQNGGIVAGLKAIGMMLLDLVLHPLQKILELIGKIPGIGKYARSAAASIQSFREGGNVESSNISTDISTSPPILYNNFASPMSGQIAQGQSFTYGSVDINVNSPKGLSNISQSGSLPQGTKLNMGYQN